MNKKTNTNFSLRKLLLTAMVAGPLATLPAPLWALPSTAAGNLSMSSGAPAPTVVSTTRLDFGSPVAPVPDKSVYSWVEFGANTNAIGANDQLNYFLPTTTNSVLNLVTGSSTTTINGQIASNGNVWVLNSNGVIIGNTAQIATGGFFVSTVPDALASALFGLNGTLSLTGTPTANVTVQNGATVQALGANNAINLYGAAIDVQGGNFFGNLSLRSFGGDVKLGTTGAVTVNAIGATTAGGKLAITTGGGNVYLTGGGPVFSAGTKSVTLSDVGGSGLNAVATIQTAAATAGQVSGIVLGTGTGYTTVPTVTLTAAPAGGTNATATATVNTTTGQVTGFTITNAGSGYTAAPTVTLTGGNGSGAVVTGVLAGDKAAISIGTGFTQANPTLSFVEGLQVLSVTATGGALSGGGYTTVPAATVPGSVTSNATTVAGTVSINTTGATVNGTVTQGNSLFSAAGGVTTVNAGSTGDILLPRATLFGLTATANNVRITEAAGTSATPTPDFLLGASTIAGNLDINLSAANNGNITSGGASAVAGTISLQTGNNTLTFAGTGNLTFANIRSASTTTITGNGDITLPNAGKVIYSVPTVTISAAPSSTNTSANATVNGTPTLNASGQVTGVTLATGGTGYTTAATITIAANGYASQTVTASSSSGVIQQPTISTPAPTYYQTATVAAPVVNGVLTTATVQAAPTGGTTAIPNGLTVDTNGRVTNITFSNGGGAGYTAAPTITLVGPNGAVTETFTTTLTNTGAIATVVPATSSGTFTVGRTLSVTTTGGKISAGTFTASSTVTLLATGDITLSGLSNPGSSVSITSSGGKISANYLQTNTSVSITAAGNINLGAAYNPAGSASTLTSRTGTVTVGSYQQTGGGTNNIVAAGDIIIPQTLSTSSGALNLTSTGGTISVGNNIVSSTTSSTLSLTAAGNIVLPNTSVNLFSVTSTTGSISQAAGTTITQASTTNVGTATSTPNKVTLNALNDIILTNANNDFNAVVLLNGGSGATGIQIGDKDSIIIGGGTATKGNVTIWSGLGTGGVSSGVFNAANGNGFIQLGNLFQNALQQNVNGSDTLLFGGNLTLNANGTTATIANKNNPLSGGGAGLIGTINTFANNILVVGATTLNTSGNQNAYLGTPGLGNLAKYSFGQVNGNVGTGTLTVNENTTLNLGTIVAGTLTATSLNGDIVNSGAITANTVNVTANSIFAPGNVSLSAAGNLIDALNVINATDLTVSVGPRTLAQTTITAGSLTNSGRAAVGTTNVTATGNVTLTTAGGGDFNIVSFTSAGTSNVIVNDPNGITLQNATNSGSGAVTLNINGPITLGSGIALGSTGLTTIDSIGATANISDSANGISIFGPSLFVSDNSIAITKAGHSLGSVSLITTGLQSSANITYTEAGSANLNYVSVNSTNNANIAGTLTVTSTGGGILQTAVPITLPGGLGTTVQGAILVPTIANATNSINFSAPTGAVTLTTAANSFSKPVTLIAAGNSSITSTSANNLTLGNVVVTGGSFAADTSGAFGRTITEATGATIRVLGATSFTTQGGAISINETGNNFGALTLQSNVLNGPGAAITLKENTTVNLAAVSTGTAGTLTVVSETGGIVESGTAGIVVGGNTSLTAGAAGVNLNIGTASNTFGGVNGSGIQVVSGGNVAIQDASSTTYLLSGTTISGSATFRNTNGAGTITDKALGGIAVTGATTFDAGRTGTSKISVTGNNNTFGAIQFTAGTGGVAIYESSTLNMAAGSSSAGATSLTSLGNIVTSGAGGSAFGGTLVLTAYGSIVISNPISVQGQLSFSSVGLTDLSILSIAGNLNFLTPNPLQYGSYKQPGS